MYLRPNVRKKNGKEHRYFSVVEKRRLADGKYTAMALIGFDPFVLTKSDPFIAKERVFSFPSSRGGATGSEGVGGVAGRKLAAAPGQKGAGAWVAEGRWARGSKGGSSLRRSSSFQSCWLGRRRCMAG